ncbi:hypothetical protein [Tannerella forsythia]|uniref:Uncharacterized protein n=1 Tax=Tannerella forsythia TaxID=28112 RepID=A0A3P1YPM0_TANFO|nr:hypothetical protein [Tannerella forsythia]RRD72665.1 hypothetical protein EII41_10775 [Tannerella forsythia]
MKTVKKTIMMMVLFAIAGHTVSAQINLKKIGKQVQRSAERQVERKIENRATEATRKGIDHAEDKAEETVEKAVEKRTDRSSSDTPGASQAQPTGSEATAAADGGERNKSGKLIPQTMADYAAYSQTLPKLYLDIADDLMTGTDLEGYLNMFPMLSEQAYKNSPSEAANGFVYRRVAECFAYAQATDNTYLLTQGGKLLDLLEKQYGVSPSDAYQQQWRTEQKRIQGILRTPSGELLEAVEQNLKKTRAHTEKDSIELYFFYAAYTLDKLSTREDVDKTSERYRKAEAEHDALLSELKAKGYDAYDAAAAKAQAAAREAEEERARMVELPTPRMRNAQLEATMLRLANAHFSGIKVEKVFIMDSDWRIQRNALGAILRRTLNTAIVVKESNGKYYLRDLSFEQPYSGGGGYGATKVYGVGVKNDPVNYKP